MLLINACSLSRLLGIITLDHFSTIQGKADNMTPPPKIGRIPRKILTALAADESTSIFYGMYFQRDFHQCWCYFVNACQLIWQPLQTRGRIVIAHYLVYTPGVVQYMLTGVCFYLKDTMVCLMLCRNPELMQLLSKFIDLHLVNTLILVVYKTMTLSHWCWEILKNMSAARSSGSVHLTAYESVILI